MRSLEEIREAAGRLHSTAWHGRRAASEAAHKVDPPADFVARFSIPRQPTDDDEVVYDALNELAALRKLADAVESTLTIETPIQVVAAVNAWRQRTPQARHGGT